MKTRLWIPIAVVAAAAVAFMFLPFKASTGVIKVECGNSLTALSMPSSEFLEITEGSEAIENWTSGGVQQVLGLAVRACEATARYRVIGVAIVLVVLAAYWIRSGHQRAA